MMLAAEVYDVSPQSSAVDDAARARPRPVGRRLRRARARGGRPRARPRRPRRSPSVDAVDDGPRASPAATCTSAATARAGCSATRPPRTAAARGSRRSSRSAARSTRAARSRSACPRSSSARARRRARRRRPRRPGASRPGCRAPGFRLLDPVKAVAPAGASSCCRCTTARRCCRASASGASCRPTAGSPGPGPALADFMRQFVVHNRMLVGGFVDRGPPRDARRHHLPGADVRRDGRRDRAARRGAPDRQRGARARRSTSARCAPGTSVSSSARRPTRDTWPTVADWTRSSRTATTLPEERRARRSTEDRAATEARRPARAGYGIELAAQVGAGVAALASSATPTRAVGALRELGGEAVAQVPRLARLERVRPQHAHLARAAARRAGRARARRRSSSSSRTARTRTRAAKHRIDSVVRGLLSLGVRQGEHVGVLMDTRPSALVVVAALNRLGAVAVLLRPDGAVAREAELGQITRVVTDPERIERGADARRAGARPRRRRAGARPRPAASSTWSASTPTRSTLPRWYRPTRAARATSRSCCSPARASARASTGSPTAAGRCRRSAPRRRPRSASADTVYSVTPVHHPSARC